MGYIWDIPKEEYDRGDYVCLESEDIVINARETRVFDEKVKTKSGMRQFITYKSPLIDVDGRIFGTCGIANDVTIQHNLNSELEVILDSMPFAILIENEAGNVVTKNARFDEFFPEFSTIVGKNSAKWKSKVLKGHQNDKEFTVKVGGENYFLISTERPIFSIFHEKIGSAIILTDVTKQTKIRQQNMLSANTDFLTGLYNRRMLFAHLGLHRCDPHMAMITLDLDNFKAVNDTYGHHTGDRALIDTARLLRDCFKPDYLINCGIAGGMSSDVKVCDIVISKDLMHHDLLPRFLAEYPPYHNTFEADEYLIKTAETVCAELGYKSHIGRIVSGEQFISDSAVKAQIVSEFSPLAVDMESSAVAHCAYRNSQPFVTIRCISDNADDEGEMTFDEFEKVAAKRVADVTLKIIDTVK